MGASLKATRSIAIEAFGHAFPGGIVTNDDLEREHPDWEMGRVAEKSGVVARHIAGPGETAFDLGLIAAREALAASAVTPEQVDGVIFCTQTPDYVMPSNAFLLHEALGMRSTAAAFDYNLACSGFVYGLAIVQGLMEIGITNRILLVTADTYSKLLNKRDRSTRAIFGDAAAATLLGVAKPGASSALLDISLASAGEQHRSFYVAAGGQRLPRSESTAREEADTGGNVRSLNDIRMNGFAVWKFIAREVPTQITELLARNGLSVSDIDLFVFHQASKLTLDSLVAALAVDPDRVVVNMRHIGNTVSASIPLAMLEAERCGRLRRGQLVLMSGFGVGLSWGTVLMRY
jgi:3-oxoacyl-[acyl-carrier-protein] synthase III